MDEPGYGIGTSRSNKVIIRYFREKAVQSFPGRQEWMTAIECIAIYEQTESQPLFSKRGKHTKLGSALDDEDVRERCLSYFELCLRMLAQPRNSRPIMSELFTQKSPVQ
ncbi:hypothetical protein V1521DRAFT_450864 [Lipomyces starkeyi]